MTYRFGCRSSTTACNLNTLKTWSALAFMASLLAEMSALKQILALLLAMRNWSRAIFPRFVEKSRQRRLSTRAIRNHIRRIRTMCWLSILNVTSLLTKVLLILTIIRPITLHPTIKRSNPTLALRLTFSFLISFRAHHSLLLPPTITPRLNQYLTTPTHPLMTAPLAIMLSTRQHIIAHLPTAPAAVIICILTPSRRRFFPAETRHAGSHMPTRRTRAGVTDHLTRMRTLPNPRLRARLSA